MVTTNDYTVMVAHVMLNITTIELMVFVTNYPMMVNDSILQISEAVEIYFKNCSVKVYS